MEEKYLGYTPDYIDSLLPKQIFVFGSNALGYHTGGASGTARKKFGAVWGQAEGLQGQCYAIPVDYGKNIRKDGEVRAAVSRFISFAKEHPDLFFLVTRVGCGIAGYHDEEMAQFFIDALELKNVSLPKSFVEALSGGISYDLERFVKAQETVYPQALKEIKDGKRVGQWMWFVFPQIKGLGHSYNSEFYGIISKEEAKAYLDHPVLGTRLREITQVLLDCNNKSADDIFGFPDVLKVRSCMTLFDLVSPDDIFNDVLYKYYEGQRCDKTIWRLGFHDDKLKHQIKFSRVTITKDCTVLLTDYDNKEVKMEPMTKAIYLLYLKHPEGIAFKRLPDYRKELADIYERIKPYGLNDRVFKSIEDVTNPLLNSINEKCSRVKAAFTSVVDPSLADHYYIIGKGGEEKKIILPRNLVIWE
jgi:uncharacterized protein (DUF1810 family)